jgi:hypothetical protein
VEQLVKNEAARAQAKRQDLTLADVWPIYLEDRKPRCGERHYQDHVNLAAPGGLPMNAHGAEHN